MSDFSSLLFPVMVVMAIVAFVRGDRRCREHINQWAAHQGMTVRSVRRRLFFFGPFWLRHSKIQRIYDVELTDADGHHRQCIVRVGGWLLGSLEPRVDAVWK